MKFKDLLESELNEVAHYDNGKIAEFIIPTMLKSNNLNLSRTQIRKIDSVPTIPYVKFKWEPQANEILECIKYFLNDYVVKNNPYALVFNNRRINENTFYALGLDFYNINDRKHALGYLYLHLKSNHFYADYGDNSNNNQNINNAWFYEFRIPNFRKNKKFLRWFDKINFSLIKPTETDLYIKFSFRTWASKFPTGSESERTINRIHRGQNNCLDIPLNYAKLNKHVILDNISFHFSTY